jgi:hypothetical protein
MRKVVQKKLSYTTWKTAILGTTLTVALFGSCKKEMPKQGQTADHKYQPSVALISATLSTFEPNTMSWTDLGIGYNDQNTRYNKAKLYLAIGLTEVVKDPAIAAWMVAEAKQHEDNVFYFDNLFARFPDTKKIMEATIDPLGEKTGWTFERIQQEMQYEDFDIKASIYLINTDIADASQKVMVTPGYDLIPADEKHPSDVALGFYTNQQNEVSRINLWEEVIAGVTAPIFAIDGRATNKPPLVITGVPLDGGMVPMGSNSPLPQNRIAITQVQIGFRYEGSGNSEYRVTGRNLFFAYWGPGTVLQGYVNASPENSRYFLRWYCGEKREESNQQYSVSASSINSWTPVNGDQYFCWTGISGINDILYSERDGYMIVNTAGSIVPGPSREKLYFNTYEDDGWITSKKTLSPTSINGVELGLKGRMGQYNEWYQTDPYNVVSWLPANTFDANSIYNYTNMETYRWGPVSKGGWAKLQVKNSCP